MTPEEIQNLDKAVRDTVVQIASELIGKDLSLHAEEDDSGHVVLSLMLNGRPIGKKFHLGLSWSMSGANGITIREIE